MSRKWKPGDVATFDLKNMPIETGVRVSANLCRDHDDLTVDHWHLSGGGFTQYDDCARPLVVINPDDRDDAARVLGAWFGHKGATYSEVEKMQKALRGLATPTPPEPTGLGAVVEDEDGTRWVRVWGRGIPAAWQGCPGDDEPDVQRHYRDITAVKVLSEGVTP